MTVPPTDPQDYEPTVTCVTGTIGVENIRYTPSGDDNYGVTAALVNGTNVSWEFYGARVSVGTTTYPDREVEIADLYAEVTEIRPGERLPITGDFYLYPPGTKPANIWWDPAAEYGFTGWPMVEGDWQFC